MQMEREAFYEPERVVAVVRERVARVRQAGESVDYLSFVPDGEPTLDLNLGREIEQLKDLGVETAVISNGSLLWREDVRKALAKADWVSLKVDAASEEIWRRVDRPHGKLRLEETQDGMLAFARDYEGVLATETMLVGGLNDAEHTIQEIAGFLARLDPDQAYLSIPTRPPAERCVHAPDERAINQAFQIVSEQVGSVEYLVGYEGNAFSFTGEVEEDLLSITAVHPMREDAVRAFLERAEADWEVVRRLVREGRLAQVCHGEHRFYMRKLNRRDQS
jgi:wyosine [tRNA(Phe)-imidazoG37] synthetase (radical SAM superfamily)